MAEVQMGDHSMSLDVGHENWPEPTGAEERHGRNLLTATARARPSYERSVTDYEVWEDAEEMVSAVQSPAASPAGEKTQEEIAAMRPESALHVAAPTAALMGSSSPTQESESEGALAADHEPLQASESQDPIEHHTDTTEQVSPPPLPSWPAPEPPTSRAMETADLEVPSSPSSTYSSQPLSEAVDTPEGTISPMPASPVFSRQQTPDVDQGMGAPQSLVHDADVGMDEEAGGVAEMPAELSAAAVLHAPAAAQSQSSNQRNRVEAKEDLHELAASPVLQSPVASDAVPEDSAIPRAPESLEEVSLCDDDEAELVGNGYESTIAALSKSPTLSGADPERPATAHLAETPTTMQSESPPRADMAAEPDEDVNERSTGSPSLRTPVHPEAAVERPESPSSVYAASPPETPLAPVSPLTRAETDLTFRDSMASIALSQSSLDYDHLTPDAVQQALATPRNRASKHMRKPSSLEILQNMWAADANPRPQVQRQNTFFDALKDEPSPTPVETESPRNPWGDSLVMPPVRASSQLKAPDNAKWHKRTTSLNAPRWTPDTSSDDQVELDWQQLDKEEEWEKEDRDLPAGAEDESTAFLLARLEQENAKITEFTKSVGSSEGAPGVRGVERVKRQSKAPSMGLLKRMISDRNAPSVRYSLALSPSSEEQQQPEDLAEPPPMTELEFWAALVQDYPSTAVRLPTLTTTKIRAGIPPPLRGVVWQSIAGARDRHLEEAFDRLQHESSPYEGIINKDVGRSFPGVELFRDAEGEGQRMLGRVLKCFSLYDTDIGYCQGLGFLVGPLLMNMPERDAFCVLVRLMDHYSLRPSFLPSLRGLHMRIFQFSSLIRQHQPRLHAHFEQLGVEPAYLSQWFLSCFAVTCPLPMLFRIYDVIFAEGANETVMRVALALMRRNEEKMLASGEFEEIMQLLLGRGIWDCYGVDADALVDDFTSLGNIITHARLAELEREFERQDAETGEKAGFLPDVQAAASRFLGRLWAPSHGAKASTSTLSPAAATGTESAGKRRTGSGLRRSASKQSISTLNDGDGASTNSSGTASLASTTATEVEAVDADVAAPLRESQADAMSFKSSKAESMRTVSVVGAAGMAGVSKEERDMHVQIEDLLTALGEMQREQAGLVWLLQREREERGEDHLVVRRLVNGLRRGDEGVDEDEEKKDRRKTLPPPSRWGAGNGVEEGASPRPKSVLLPRTKVHQDGDVDDLLESVAQRLQTHTRTSHSFETKAEIRSKLTRTREQLAATDTLSHELAGRLDIAETSLAAFTTEAEDLRAEVRELRVRVNEEFKTRQKLEHAIRELKAEARVAERREQERAASVQAGSGARPGLLRRDSSALEDGAGPGKRGSMVGNPGLRELRLVRRDSSSSVQSLRARRGPRPAPPDITVQTQQLPPLITHSPTSAADTAAKSPSPPFSAVTLEEPTPISTTAPPSGLSVPAPSALWHARTSSLATKEVLATPEHEVVPDEALLLELVNAKTAEAQSRAEVDELKRALLLSNRRHEHSAQALQAQLEAANAVAGAARMEAQAARDAAELSRQQGGSRAPSLVGRSAPGTPVVALEGENCSLHREMGVQGTLFAVGEKALPDVPGSARKEGTGSGSSGGGGGGWFWNRRTPSVTTQIAVTPPAE
ncbi:hypothetical protein LTR53_010075 [Teratosphaeriaceae sp. CCFEE 6253]|nr:hypothetical protein LTR53_010075 [Teratosphaeriaceae sp. CCFEE 6253]